MQRTSKWVMALITMVMLFSNSLAGNWVQAADGDSDGSGGGQNNPLIIESSTPVNGASGVTDLPYIKIVFSKNIAYMTVRDGNLKCFSLWSDGQKMPAEIIIADDQIEREKRNDVLVKPLQPLKAGTTYQVEIASELQSKSGVTLGQKATLTFTMAGGSQATGAVTPGSVKPSSSPAAGITPNEVAPTITAAETEAAVTSKNEAETFNVAPPAAEQNKADGGSKSNNLLWAALGAAAVISVGWFYYRSKQK